MCYQQSEQDINSIEVDNSSTRNPCRPVDLNPGGLEKPSAGVLAAQRLFYIFKVVSFIHHLLRVWACG